MLLPHASCRVAVCTPSAIFCRFLVLGEVWRWSSLATGQILLVLQGYVRTSVVDVYGTDRPFETLGMNLYHEKVGDPSSVIFVLRVASYGLDSA